MSQRFLGLAVLGCAILALGCYGDLRNPVSAPTELSTVDLGLSASAAREEGAQTHLWGLYEISVDFPSQNVSARLNRQAMFTANVVSFLNGNPAYLGFKINGTPVGPDYVDIDIDVGITHPFPGFPQYNGYDVRGVFMGDGSASMAYNGDLIYPVLGEDQFMLADLDDGYGGPDGYTRWFNYSEFLTGGMPLFSYTPGKAATPGFAGTSTLNPYKYFADSLGVSESLWDWLVGHPDDNGQFSSGAKNERNYYLRFPNTKKVVFGYAVLASWEGPENHPANAPEAVGCKVEDGSDVWYVDPSQNGGSLILDISVFDWGSELSAGVMEDYRILVESTVLSAVYEFDSGDMTPVGGNDSYSTYHVEMAADDVAQPEGNEYWVIVEYPVFDYTNEYGVVNDAWEDPLAAFFRYDLEVSGAPTNEDPICDLVVDPSTPVPATDLSPVAIKFDASGSTDPDGDTLTFEWDFNGDSVYDGPEDSYHGDPGTPTHGYVEDYDGKAYLKVTDGKGGESICSVDVEVTALPSKNLPLRSGVTPYDLALETGDGDLTILYNDEWIYKRLASEYHQTGHAFYQKLYNTWPAPQYHESNPEGYTGNGGTVTVGAPPWSTAQVFYYKPDASGPYDFEHLWSCQFMEPMPENKYIDLAAFGTEGSRANDMAVVYGYDMSGYHWIRIMPHYDTHFDFSGWVTSSWSGGTLTGYDKLYWEYCVAVETDKTGDYMWFVENTDFYASRWQMSGSSLTYNSAYFGTGSQTDDDDGWYTAKDITRDDQNRYFVLDELSSGQARVKMWTVEGNTTTSKGGFGDSTTIQGAPLRIEGGDFSGRVFVIHGNPSSGFFLSVFSPIEMPE